MRNAIEKSSLFPYAAWIIIITFVALTYFMMVKISHQLDTIGNKTDTTTTTLYEQDLEKTPLPY